MDQTSDSFGRKIKSQVCGKRGVLVRLTLPERNQLRANALAAGLSLQAFCYERLMGGGDSTVDAAKMPTLQDEH